MGLEIRKFRNKEDYTDYILELYDEPNTNWIKDDEKLEVWVEVPDGIEEKATKRRLRELDKKGYKYNVREGLITDLQKKDGEDLEEMARLARKLAKTLARDEYQSRILNVQVHISERHRRKDHIDMEVIISDFEAPQDRLSDYDHYCDDRETHTMVLDGVTFYRRLFRVVEE